MRGRREERNPLLYHPYIFRALRFHLQEGLYEMPNRANVILRLMYIPRERRRYVVSIVADHDGRSCKLPRGTTIFSFPFSLLLFPISHSFASSRAAFGISSFGALARENIHFDFLNEVLYNYLHAKHTHAHIYIRLLYNPKNFRRYRYKD